MTLSPATKSAIVEAAAHGGPKAAMLDALKLVQQAEGWVSDADLAEAAATLGVTPAEIDSLATFYSQIFRQPVGETVILLCDGLSCYLCGGDAVRDAVMQKLGIGFGETTPDGKFTLINICCIGGCDRAPAALVGPDRKLVGPLTPDDLAALIGGAP
ncbi:MULTISPECIES: NADH-quinone oxidoreductase subunit NuoE [Rhodopseudomonas]|uniref:NADH dehydrogenase n=1 Tax=Rhodopseudomonas palustris TaxID=1076 RepID=A0A0D7F345_RHOPL|nr:MULTISPECIES: NADH-quinone oxidoreductase subunit NuoE [Rhodopseudomonas]KIZ47479.1 NADH dehydrogenase [Rhodopseudomonas palustris]MDF3813867.1 NADH-quinone oxidoreductase subunit NuoE [Rhodopseudomonas sp. BAL398]WOK15458.1 NADH-quinone oxidoreductase subunit NuoE [Rhodopseudomonas sp. BAL398]